METSKKTIASLGVKTGLVTSFLLIAYFLLMKAFGLAHISELRYFNFFILFGALLYAYRHYKEPNQNIEYLPGIGLGFITVAASVLPFAIFIYHYFWYLDPNLLEVIKHRSAMMGAYINATSIAGVIIVEGLASGGILSFALMQYYKSGFEKKEKQLWTQG